MPLKKEIPKETIEVRERPIKSLAKTITYRFFAFFATFIAALLFFKDDAYAYEKATGIASVEAIFKMLLYFLHERAWNVIRWGKMRVYVRHYDAIRKRVVKRIMISKQSPKD
jgi:uncharacterized membrane protein